MFRAASPTWAWLANDGVLVYAGPMDGVDGWRGIFIMAVTDIATARQHAGPIPCCGRARWCRVPFTSAWRTPR